jgi:K+-sensing histidine kinase KdpD
MPTVYVNRVVARACGYGSIIIEKHGGSIDVQNAVGKGTRFVLRLPVARRSCVNAT